MGEYRGRQVAISYDETVCTHAGECVGKFPAIFDVNRKPWIDPDSGSVEDAKAAIRNCPSGALTMREL